MKLDEFKGEMTKIKDLCQDNPEVQGILTALESDYATMITEKDSAIQEKEKAIKERDEYSAINKELWKASHTTIVEPNNVQDLNDTKQEADKKITIADLDLD